MTMEHDPMTDLDLATDPFHRQTNVDGTIDGAPPEMMRTRIVQMPDNVYVPPADLDPGARIVVRYDEFMAVVREMGGSGLQAFKTFSEKLAGAIDTGAQAEFAAALADQYNAGFEAGKSEGFATGFEEGAQAATAAAEAMAPVTGVNVDASPAEAGDGADGGIALEPEQAIVLTPAGELAADALTADEQVNEDVGAPAEEAVPPHAKTKNRRSGR